MLKHYFENIEWYDYLIYLVYDLIFSWFLFKLGDAFLNINKRTLRILLIIFQFYFLLIIGDSFFNFLPYLPDSELYSYMISSGQYPKTSSENLIALYYLTLFVGTICLGDPVIYMFFCIMIYIAALMIFIKAWKKVNPAFDANAETIAAILFLLWPAPMIYMTAPLREGFIMFGFALFFNGFLIFLKEKKWKSLITGTIIMCAIRLQLIVFAFPVIGVLLMNKLRINKIMKTAILCATIAIAFLAVRYILVEEPVTPASIAALRDRNLGQAGPLGYGNVHWVTFGDMAKDVPFIILQFIFSPLPIFVQHNPISTFIPFLDVLFLIFLLVIIFSKLRYFIKNNSAILLFLLFFIILFGGYEYHITGAVRHRMPLEIILILMVAPFISKRIFKNKNETTEHTAVDHQ